MGSGTTPIIGNGDPGADEVRQQLHRILANRRFATSARLSKFLKYGVEAALAGRRTVNEYSIGVDVFERSSNFDPRVDPIVRVHARRLRSKLGQYYETDGSNDSLEIHLPLRSYIPFFRWREPRPLRSNQEAVQPDGCRRLIAVLPFVNLSIERDDEYFAEGLTREVIHSLTRVTDLRVASLTPQEPRPDLHDLAGRLGFQMALSGTVRKSNDARLRVSAELTSAADRMVLWSQMFDVEAASVIPSQEKIARAICHAVRRQLEASPGASKPTNTARAPRLFIKVRYG
jgi:serine/threonine-protein kinase